MKRANLWRIVTTMAVIILTLNVTFSGTTEAAPKQAGSVTHNIKTVFLILMENHNWTGDSKSISTAKRAEYINKVLVPMASHANQYYNPPGVHPSLPNYLWLEAGTNFGILHDGLPAKYSQNTTDHLVTYLDKAGVTWKAYLENADGKTCPLGNEGIVDPNGSHSYAVRHEPFAYFNDVTDNRDKNSPKCIAHLRPFRELAGDLRDNTVAQYNFITPNLCDDMHDGCDNGAIRNGDEWLATDDPSYPEVEGVQRRRCDLYRFRRSQHRRWPNPPACSVEIREGQGLFERSSLYARLDAAHRTGDLWRDPRFWVTPRTSRI
ncbi:MAG: alkaline phosphatase family protein [Rhizomicrobium sp.]